MRKLRFALAALALAVPVAAQVRESVTVEVIDVPVYVTSGNAPVTGLTKDNFEVYVNGTKRPIEYFDTIDFSPAAQTETANAPRDIRDRRLFLLLFDLVFSRPAAIEHARKAAVAMIDGAAKSDYFAVATFTRTGGVKMIVPFSNDHALARLAARTLAAPAQRDPLSIAMSQNERVTTVVGEDFGGKYSSDEEIRQETALKMYQYDSLHDNEQRPMQHLIEDQLLELDHVGDRLAPLEGYKHVVFFSEGFPPQAVYSNLYTTDGVLFGAMKAMFDSFRRANAVVDTIDIGNNMERDTAASDALRMVAVETGGQFIGTRADVKAALTKISTLSQTGYHLGFARPADAKEMNTIEVRVHGLPRGANVSYRKGFSTAKPDTSEFDALRIADIMLNDIPQSGVPPRIEFPEKPFVEVQVPQAAVENGVGNVLFYVFDSTGAVVNVKQMRVTGGAIVRGKLELPPGSYVAKALVQSGSSVGFTRVAFTIH